MSNQYDFRFIAVVLPGGKLEHYGRVVSEAEAMQIRSVMKLGMGHLYRFLAGIVRAGAAHYDRAPVTEGSCTLNAIIAGDQKTTVMLGHVFLGAHR